VQHLQCSVIGSLIRINSFVAWHPAQSQWSDCVTLWAICHGLYDINGNNFDIGGYLAHILSISISQWCHSFTVRRCAYRMLRCRCRSTSFAIRSYIVCNFTEDVHLRTPALRIGTHFLLVLTLETVVFLFHLLSTTSKPFSSLYTRLAHSARLGFFYKKRAI